MMKLIKITPSQTKKLNAKWASCFGQSVVAERDHGQTGIYILKYKRTWPWTPPHSFLGPRDWQSGQYAVVGEELKNGKIQTAYVKNIKPKKYENEVLTEQEFKEKYFIRGL